MSKSSARACAGLQTTTARPNSALMRSKVRTFISFHASLLNFSIRYSRQSPHLRARGPFCPPSLGHEGSFHTSASRCCVVEVRASVAGRCVGRWWALADAGEAGDRDSQSAGMAGRAGNQGEEEGSEAIRCIGGRYESTKAMMYVLLVFIPKLISRTRKQ